MLSRFLSSLAAGALLLGSASDALAGTARPGPDTLESRLREAERKVQPPAPAASRTGRRRAVRRSSPGRAHRGTRRRETRRRTHSRTARHSRRWSFESANVQSVTYSVDPRNSDSIGRPHTGDLILTAEPADATTYFYRAGGSNIRGTTRVVLKDQPLTRNGQKLYILAVAPEIGGRAQAFVPVKANAITTVRFVFRDRRAARK